MILPQTFTAVPISHVDTIYHLGVGQADLGIILRALQHAERNPSDGPRIDELIKVIRHAIYCARAEVQRQEHPVSDCGICANPAPIDTPS